MNCNTQSFNNQPTCCTECKWHSKRCVFDLLTNLKITKSEISQHWWTSKILKHTHLCTQQKNFKHLNEFLHCFCQTNEINELTFQKTLQKQKKSKMYVFLLFGKIFDPMLSGNLFFLILFHRTVGMYFLLTPSLASTGVMLCQL